MPIFRGGRFAQRDVVRYWSGPPRTARGELEALLKGCQSAGGRVDEACIDRVWALDRYLRKEVAAAPERFVRTKRLWRQTPSPTAFPVYRTLGDPFVVFTIYHEESGEPVVTALHFGREDKALSPSEWDETLWHKVIAPRLRLLAAGGSVGSGGAWVERGRET